MYYIQAQILNERDSWWGKLIACREGTDVAEEKFDESVDPLQIVRLLCYGFSFLKYRNKLPPVLALGSLGEKCADG